MYLRENGKQIGKNEKFIELNPLTSILSPWGEET